MEKRPSDAGPETVPEPPLIKGVAKEDLLDLVRSGTIGDPSNIAEVLGMILKFDKRERKAKDSRNEKIDRILLTFLIFLQPLLTGLQWLL
jgi:hypothetical protein